ncbi:MAG TPA: LptF/LptG family permease [Thermoanaerobaculia bacterium]|nr:LptF/LptG family permease [Thermoanaerobaculia bacterium]
MRLISRSVLREVWAPTVLGFVAYTFLLLLRTVFLLTDFFVRRSATLAEVAWMLLLSVPWIVVLTIPMAFLLGVLVGVGRLSADSELVALRSCGVGPGAVYRPLIAAGVGLTLLVFVLYNEVLPRSNELLSFTMARLAATSVVNLVSPRTFREPRPGATLFFDRVGADGRSLEGVFLSLGDEEASDHSEVIVARRGALTMDQDALWLELESSTVHQFSPSDPSRYRVSWNRAQRILFASGLGGLPRSRASSEKGLRAQSLSELYASARREPGRSTERYRMAWVEIHKKFAIPAACLAFALIGIPLAETSRRGGRGSSFAISLAILVAYYVLLSSGETWAQTGALPPGLSMWLPDLLLAAAGLLLLKGLGRERARWRRAAPAAEPEPTPGAALPRPRRAWLEGFLRFPAILDRYVLRRFLSAFALVFLSVLLVSVVIDYADQSDEILRNHPPVRDVLAYYRNFLLSIGNQVAPFVVLVSTLLAFGTMSKNNEDTACRASGVSLHRLGAPLLIVAVLGAAAAFWLGETLLPLAAQREARYRNILHGRPPESGLHTAAERTWHYEPDGRIWHREEGPPGGSSLLSPSVFELGPDFQLVRRTAARQADWNGTAWIFRQGWSRSFAGARETSYDAFLERPVSGEPPRAFQTESRTGEQMRYRELERYVRRLSRTGYPTEALRTALAQKIARPLLLPLMAVVALPFAFRLGRRGALAGIGVGLLLGMVLLVLSELFTRLGAVGALPPALAAWTPSVLFATGAAFLLLKLRT